MLNKPVCALLLDAYLKSELKMSVSVFWFRRDLRLYDNHGLLEALKSGNPVIPLFIFDENILSKLSHDDRRVPFIHRHVTNLHKALDQQGSGLLVMTGDPVVVFAGLMKEMDIAAVYTNKDYEPYAVSRDNQIRDLLATKNIRLYSFNDHLIFEPHEIVKNEGTPYEIFTPFSKRWIKEYQEKDPVYYHSEKLFNYFSPVYTVIPELKELGFDRTEDWYPDNELPINLISDYSLTRDFPWMDSTTRIGPHLRFGTISIRRCVSTAIEYSSTWLNELIWREFFTHILAFYPEVTEHAFKRQYDSIQWLNDERMFSLWIDGMTGYPLVDAGMRELKATGFMHNRVRMVTASFLVKHLLIDWRWGEAYFASQLLDYDLASNNGNWQWVAGCGCDAAPYFRIFNPLRQQQRFDPDMSYIKRWIPEFGNTDYPDPIVNHEFARDRCIKAYKKVLV